MTVIRAPSDDDGDDLVKEPVQTDAEGQVSKAVGKSIKYIRRVLGLKTRRKRRKKLRAPAGFKATRNPFFNFLRHLQVELQGMSASEVAQEGGRRWRLMSDRDKEPYRDMARNARPFSSKGVGRGRASSVKTRSPSASHGSTRNRGRGRGRSRSRSRRRRRSRSRRRHRSRSHSRRRNRGI